MPPGGPCPRPSAPSAEPRFRRRPRAVRAATATSTVSAAGPGVSFPGALARVAPVACPRPSRQAPEGRCATAKRTDPSPLNTMRGTTASTVSSNGCARTSGRSSGIDRRSRPSANGAGRPSARTRRRRDASPAARSATRISPASACGSRFPRRTGSSSPWCNRRPECAPPPRPGGHDSPRYLRARAEGEPIVRAVVLERDGWRCRLCGYAIDPALRAPHPGSATIDHVVPVARGGAHTYANVQAAHRFCNTSKGARRTA